ncbi:MAG: DNA polymerase II [Halieaceae bacterium]
MSDSSTGFILSRNWRDSDHGVELELWLSTAGGPRRVLLPGQQVLFFLPAEDVDRARELLGSDYQFRLETLALKDFNMEPVVGVYFSSQRQLRQARDCLQAAGLDPLEADINPVDRFLMERFVAGSLTCQGEDGALQLRTADYQPQLKMLSLDIETAMGGLELYSIGVYGVLEGEVQRKVFMRGVGAGLPWVESFASERELLRAFCEWLQVYDPDVLIGWNVVNFDLWFLQRVAEKLRVKLPLGRAGRLPHWRELDDDGERRAVQIPGRAVLDGIEVLRTATYRFESFSLENVSRELLGAGKLLHGSQRGEQIGELFREDKDRLAEYNIRDCELVWEIFEHSGLLQFSIARSQMTGLAMDRLGGSVAAFDYLYLPRLHRQGFVAPNASREQTASPGGFVLDSQPGIYEDVLVLDFKSLYPSIIRSFCVDPLGLALGMSAPLDSGSTIDGFLGARFSRQQHLLPQIIAELWQLRDAAKLRGDSAQSQAIKIIMNSFYGVLGTPGCRFFDPRLASSITRRGHQIIQDTRDQIERLGDQVIYGDTDSVFVSVGEAHKDKVAERGEILQRELNQWWTQRLRQEFGIDSVLELEFETHFRPFLMPTVRGSDKGSKKRYAGVVEQDGKPELVFKGLENVRTDWTALARRFQRELYRRVFAGEPYEAYICELRAQVESGQLDGELIYRKRLRRKLDDYERNIPPHVQAARLQRQRGEQPPVRGDWVEYVMTSQGAEPAAAAEAGLDYQYYIERQLTPVADGILHFLGTSFAEISGKQGSLF